MSGIGLVDIVTAVLFILFVMLALTFGAYLIWIFLELITAIRMGRKDKNEHES